MSKFEIAIDYAEKFPRSCDDCEQVAIKQAYAEENENLSNRSG